MNKEQIVYKKINELHLNEKNPRKNDDAVGTVAKSIEKYGFKNPLIVDSKGKIWCGNTRYKASKKLGLKEVPCIIADDLTEEQIREYALLDNKTNELADWDFDLLGEELAELDLSDFDLDWGVDIDENYGTEFTLPSGDKSDFEQITFTLHKSQAELIRGGLDLVENYEETYGNTNKNGNALYTIVKQWVDNRG